MVRQLRLFHFPAAPTSPQSQNRVCSLRLTPASRHMNKPRNLERSSRTNAGKTTSHDFRLRHRCQVTGETTCGSANPTPAITVRLRRGVIVSATAPRTKGRCAVRAPQMWYRRPLLLPGTRQGVPQVIKYFSWCIEVVNCRIDMMLGCKKLPLVSRFLTVCGLVGS
jgi:hypothetical protein